MAAGGTPSEGKPNVVRCRRLVSYAKAVELIGLIPEWTTASTTAAAGAVSDDGQRRLERRKMSAMEAV